MRSLALTFLGFTYLASAIAADPPLRVEDSKGTYIGPLFQYAAGTMVVPIKVLGHRTLLGMTTQGFVGGSLYFSTSDCSGPPYIDDRLGRNAPFAPSSVMHSEASHSILYVADYSLPREQIAVHGFRADGRSCDPESNPHNRKTSLRPVATFDLTSRFVPPFYLRVGSDVVDLSAE